MLPSAATLTRPGSVTGESSLRGRSPFFFSIRGRGTSFRPAYLSRHHPKESSPSNTLTMKLTHELIEAGRSLNGGWSRKQTSELGVPWPLEHGWKTKLIGKEVSDNAYRRFLSMKDRHLGGPLLEKAADAMLKKKPAKADPVIRKRARMLVATANGSNTTTCTAASCTYPSCMCVQKQ